KPGAEGKVMTSVDTKSFSGPIPKSVLLVSNDPERAQINLFIKATVKPYVDVLPQPYVRMSVVKGDSDARDVIILSEEKSFKPTAPIKVTKAEVSVPGFITDVVPTQEGVSYTVVVKASERVKKGPLEGTVKLFTTDKEKSVIELPLRGEVL